MKAQITILLTFVCFVTHPSKSSANRPDGRAEATPKEVVQKFLDANRNQNWKLVYQLLTEDAKTTVLADAWVNVNLEAGTNTAAGRTADALLQRHYDATQAKKELENLPKSTSDERRLRIKVSHIKDPEVFFAGWMELELGLPQVDTGVATLENLAFAKKGDLIEATGDHGVRITLQKEVDAWRVALGWSIKPR